MDYYAAKFVLSYDGGNPAILRLQMHLMCWDVNIVHHPDVELMNVDYWSWLGVDVNYDPLLRNYLAFTMKMCSANLLLTDLPMRPENMPYYRGPRIREPKPTASPMDALHMHRSLPISSHWMGLGTQPWQTLQSSSEPSPTNIPL